MLLLSLGTVVLLDERVGLGGSVLILARYMELGFDSAVWNIDLV